MLKKTISAWSFRSDRSLGTMRAALEEGWSGTWVWLDSDYKRDSIAGPVTNHAKARIYRFGIDAYILNLTVVADETGLGSRASEAGRQLLDGVLPLLAARDVEATEPTDGMDP